MSDLGWKLINIHCLIWIKTSSENKEFGLNNFQKKKSHLNALGSKFDLDVK